MILDLDRYPTIEFVSTGLWSTGENYYELGGLLTLRGVTKDVSLDLVFNGVVTDTWGKRRLGVAARTELSRDDFGAGGSGHVVVAGGGFMVAHGLKVTLDVEATKDGEAASSTMKVHMVESTTDTVRSVLGPQGFAGGYCRLGRHRQLPQYVDPLGQRGTH